MIKEFTIGDFKITDNGYKLVIYMRRKDEFGNIFFKQTSVHDYAKPPGKKEKKGVFNMFHLSEDGLLIKELLEENANLKFYDKLDKELKK